jgi:hypothetical protein
MRYCRVLWFSILGIVICVGSYAVTKNISIEKLLPGGDDMAGWKPGESSRIFKNNQLFDYIDGGADLYLEYGFVQVVTQEYINGDQSVMVDIYEMSDAAAAFGIYSSFRDFEKQSLEIGGSGTLFDYQVTFWQDRYYGVVMGYENNESTHAALIHLAKKISDNIGTNSPQPPLLNLLPRHGLIQQSCGWVEGLLGINTLFYLGKDNILGIDGLKVQAAFGHYQIGSNTGLLLLVQYGSDGEAQEKGQILKAQLNEKFQVEADSNFFRDDRDRYYATTTHKNLLLFFFRLSDKALAAEITGTN